jgi:hypothetical protein
MTKHHLPNPTLAHHVLLTLLALVSVVTSVLFSGRISEWPNVLCLIMCGLVVVNMVLLLMAQAKAHWRYAAVAAERARHGLLLVEEEDANTIGLHAETESSSFSLGSASLASANLPRPLHISTGPALSIMLATTALLLVCSLALQAHSAEDVALRMVCVYMLIAVSMSAAFAAIVR